MVIGSLVTRKSYNKDIIFEICKIENDIYYLKGVYVRLYATSYLDDLVLVTDEMLRNKDKTEENIETYIISQIKKNKNYLTGKILHLDGDKKYLEKCMNLYKDLGIYAIGYSLDEKDFSNHILSFIDDYNPDIIVITGHDSYNNKGLRNLDNYKNSKYFYETIKKIRNKFYKNEILIIAGACQSNYEALIAAGANFAMSKKRVNIHAFDPAIIAIKSAITPFNKIIKIEDIFKYSQIKNEGIGGVESYGKMRLLI